MLVQRQKVYCSTIKMNQLQIIITIIDFPVNNNSISFKFRQLITGQRGKGSTKDIKIMVPSKYVSKFWRTIEIPLINCKLCLQLKWSKDTAGTGANQVPEIKITYAKLYIPVVTFLTQDNIKLLKQLESGFKRIINCNKYQSKKQLNSIYLDIPLDFLIDPGFQGVDRLFVL